MATLTDFPCLPFSPCFVKMAKNLIIFLKFFKLTASNSILKGGPASLHDVLCFSSTFMANFKDYDLQDLFATFVNQHVISIYSADGKSKLQKGVPPKA